MWMNAMPLQCNHSYPQFMDRCLSCHLNAASSGIRPHGHHRCASHPITTLSWGSALQCTRPISDPNRRNALLRWTRQGLQAEGLSVPAAAWSSPCLEWLEGGVGSCLTRISLHCSFPAEYSRFAFVSLSSPTQLAHWTRICAF